MALASVAGGQQVDNFDMQLLRGDGRLVNSLQISARSAADDGSVSSVVVVMTDVTDSAMLQTKLMHTEENGGRGALVSGVRARGQQSPHGHSRFY